MALTKITRELLNTGIDDNSNATAITIDSSENSTFSGDVTITSSTSNKPELKITNTNADANPSYLKFIKDSASPADNDELGRIYMYGDDDAGNSTEAVLIRGIMTDVSNGSEDSTLEFFTYSGGSQTSTLTLASGNVGIGTTSPDAKLEVESGASASHIVRSKATVADGYRVGFETQSTHTGGGHYSMFTTNNGDGYFGGGKFVIASETMGDVDANTSGILVLDSSGNVGIGTSSVDTKLHIKDGSSDAATQMAFENDARQWRIGVHGGLSDMFTIFDATANATRLSLTSTGDCRFGTTNDMSAKFAVVNTANQPVFVADHANNSGFSQTIIDSACAQNGGSYFFYKAQIRGIANKFIVAQDGNVTNTNNSYNAISDQRLKTDIADASSQWDDIKALKVRKFKLGMQPDDGFKIGVVSQELEASGMNGLVQEKDADEYQIAYNSDLKDQKVKEVKYSILYMKAIKALQEAMTRIETLETKVKTLEDA